MSRDLRDLMTIDQAADLIGVKPNTLRHWLSRRLMTYVKMGSLTRIWLDDLIAFVESGTVPGIANCPKPIGENLISRAEDSGDDAERRNKKTTVN